MSSSNDISKKYTRKDLHSHVHERPGMYLGEIRPSKQESWLFEKDMIIKKEIEYSQGLYKIIDEILVNSIDNSINDPTMKNIKVDIDTEKGEISVYNDGKGIPNIKHSEYNIYIPELIFGNLLTSSSYNEENRITGSINGLGSKVCNIYSKKFKIINFDVKTGIEYTQTFYDNMYKKTEPVLKKLNKKTGYTLISFIPDYKRFNVEGLTEDFLKVIKRRVYDCVACTEKKVNVYYNGDKLLEKNFIDYIRLYTKEEIFYEKIEDNGFTWELGIVLQEEGYFKQVSFVNGVFTNNGGKHVDHLTNQLVKKLSDILQTKKKITGVKPSYFKDKLFIFLKSVIVNPSFSSQIKDNLTTPVKDFGVSKIIISDNTISKICKKTSILEDVSNLVNFKNNKTLIKADSSIVKKVSRLKIENLEDALYAGGKKSENCSLILTEGLSAKTFALSGLSIIGREFYGIFPLKGVLLNTRDCSNDKLTNNQEIKNLKQIIGLQHGKKYENVKDLRYGSIIILTDQDYDGFHISALIINFIHSFWPELLEVKGFIKKMKTPIVKLTSKKEILEFYTLQDYKSFENSKNISNYSIKYYKGLGTSTAKEAKELFKKIDKNTISYYSKNSKDTENSIKLAFEKSQTDNRKEWLKTYNYNLVPDQKINDISYSQSINEELIHFSIYDVYRSIPSVCDGLKPSQRKVLYTLFTKNKKDIKVAQLGALVAEHTMYLHGENSLFLTIIGMAQDYVGSNNINLLKPLGQFGSKYHNGKDYASPRYIYTELIEDIYNIFSKEDFHILEYLVEENKSIEPRYYVPIIPIILVNGALGIGTGYSTNIPCFNLKDIKENMINYLENRKMKHMLPYYKGFKGSIEKSGSHFIIYGKISQEGKKIIVSEIPVGISTKDYIEFLNVLQEENCYISDILNYSSDIDIDIHIVFKDNKSLDNFLEDFKEVKDIYKYLKLVKSISSKNYHLIDSTGSIKYYKDELEILEDFIKLRIQYNVKRKKFLQGNYSSLLEKLSNKLKFIKDIVSKKLLIFNKSKKEIIHILSKENFKKYDDSFSYLLDTNIYNFTRENIEKLEREYTETLLKLKEIENKNYKEMSIDDLNKIIL